MPPPSNTSNTNNEHAHSTTSSRLARAHGIVVRQIADLLAMLPNYRGLASLSESLDVSPEDVTGLQVSYKLSRFHTVQSLPCQGTSFRKLISVAY